MASAQLRKENQAGVFKHNWDLSFMYIWYISNLYNLQENLQVLYKDQKSEL